MKTLDTGNLIDESATTCRFCGAPRTLESYCRTCYRPRFIHPVGWAGPDVRGQYHYYHESGHAACHRGRTSEGKVIDSEAPATWLRCKKCRLAAVSYLKRV